MTALERMAKAVLEAHQRAFRAKFPLPEGATPDGTWETLAPEYRQRHLDTMRAALEAIREPGATIALADRVIRQHGYSGDIDMVWRCTVDAILNGEE